MLDCGRWILACIAAWLACGVTATTAWAEDPFAGFIAVPQVWPSAALMEISPDRRFLAVVADSEVDVVALTSGTILRRLETGRRLITGAGTSTDSRSIVAVVEDGSRLAWDAETGRLLPAVPAGVSLKWKWKDNGPQPYKFTVSSPSDDQPARLQISSGTKSITTLHADIEPPTCGSHLAAPVFDGKYLVYGRSAGEGDGLFTPAITFELKDGAFHEIWRAPCNAFGHDGGGQLFNDAKYLDLSLAPVGTVTIWDLETNRIAASFEDADGLVAISKDERTIVASAYADEADLAIPVFKILHDGRTRLFPRETKDIQRLVLSPNGRWLAAQDENAISVWSTDDGHRRRIIQPDPDTQAARLEGIANDGTVINTPSERATFHDDRLDIQSPDGHWGAIGRDIFDLKSDRRVTRLVDGYAKQLSVEGHGLVELFPAEAWRLLDLSKGRPLWTLQLTPDVQGYVLTSPDGCVQVAAGSEGFVKLVRGFDVRPFDAAAAGVFAKPGCKGRPDAIAASDAAFAADQASLAAMAREDEDEKIRARNAAAAETDRLAAQAEVLRRAEDAGRQVREKIKGLWDHPETRIAGGPHRAVLRDKWPVALAPGRVSSYYGTVTWALAKDGDRKVAIGQIALPDVHAHATIELSIAKGFGTNGTMNVTFAPDDPGFGISVKSIAMPVGRGEASASGHVLAGALMPAAGDTFRIDLHGRAGIDQLLAAYWIDLPLAESNLFGTLTFEKGTDGQRIIVEALAPR